MMDLAWYNWTPLTTKKKRKKETPVKMAVSDGLVALYCCFFFLRCLCVILPFCSGMHYLTCFLFDLAEDTEEGRLHSVTVEPMFPVPFGSKKRD